jgi:hypothetical protein
MQSLTPCHAPLSTDTLDLLRSPFIYTTTAQRPSYLRDYVEEQLEREYDVCAQLSISCEGTMEVGIAGEPNETLLKDLRALAERSLREFIALRLNTALKELQT